MRPFLTQARALLLKRPPGLVFDIPDPRRAAAQARPTTATPLAHPSGKSLRCIFPNEPCHPVPFYPCSGARRRAVRLAEPVQKQTVRICRMMIWKCSITASVETVAAVSTPAA